MGEQGLSTSFVQKVFDEISLEKNVQLWMSADDSYLQHRIEFLAEYPQTLFSEHLFATQKKSNLAKNPILCQGFASKSDKCMEKQEWNQVTCIGVSFLLPPLLFIVVLFKVAVLFKVVLLKVLADTAVVVVVV